MSKYELRLSGAAEKTLLRLAAEEGVTPEEKAESLLHLLLVRPHNMDGKSMKEGYKAMGAINLEWAER